MSEPKLNWKGGPSLGRMEVCSIESKMVYTLSVAVNGFS